MIDHCLRARQFDRPLIERLCASADRLRAAARDKAGADRLASLLSDKRAVLCFAQPSTRTFLSFANACHILGARFCDLRDMKASSQAKGESWEDTVRTFASYADFIVVRHPEADAAERAARTLEGLERAVRVVNAGSGPDEHPTQALLDVYTLARRGGIDGKRVAFVGDLKRGRAVRSLALMLRPYRVTLSFVSPPEFRPREDLLALLAEGGLRCEQTEDFEGELAKADVLYMTRVQDEYDSAGESRKVDVSRYRLGPEHLARLKPSAQILHPLPRRSEIDPGVDDDPRAAYWDQERNGLWIRAALLLLLSGRDGKV